MRTEKILAGCVLAGLLVASSALAACNPEDATPEQIIEGQAVKLVRGITNVVTAPVELPKQIYTTTRDRGVPGPLIGLFKGIGMTVYRAVFGAVEAATFLIPAPGFYDPMTNPPYVWQGWARKMCQPCCQAPSGPPPAPPAAEEP